MYIEIYFFAVDKRKITTLDQSYVSMGLWYHESYPHTLSEQTSPPYHHLLDTSDDIQRWCLYR